MRWNMFAFLSLEKNTDLAVWDSFDMVLPVNENGGMNEGVRFIAYISIFIGIC